MYREKKLSIAVLSVLFSLGPFAHSTVGFRSAQSYPVGTAPKALAVADFVGDGRRDLAVANFGDPNTGDNGGVSISLGNGNGTFQSAKNFAAGKNPTLIAAGDFDGDGKSDLAVLRQGGASVNDNGDTTIFLSNGDGTFRKGQTLVPGNTPSGIAVGDVNADHKLDLIITSLNPYSVSVLLGNGDGSFQSPVTYALGRGPFSVTLVDFDLDGRIDLAIFLAGYVDFLLGNGDGTFRTGPTVSIGSPLFFPMTLGDFNRDSKIDLVVHECHLFPSTGCNTVLRLGNGDGTFQAPIPIPDISLGVTAPAVAADLNGDGKLDLAGSNGTQVVVSLGNGDGTFQQPLTLTAAAKPAVPVIADLNGDKAPDLVTL